MIVKTYKWVDHDGKYDLFITQSLSDTDAEHLRSMHTSRDLHLYMHQVCEDNGQVRNTIFSGGSDYKSLMV